VIDDDETVAETFSRMLRLEGFEVAAAVEAGRGLALAEEVRPDAIILDLRMPLMNGLQLLRAIRARPHLVDVPVAVVTGDYFLGESTALELQALGASVRFKPLWLEDLVALAKALVAA
jgi:DNA-binding response OmpR family regulator